LLLDNGAQIHPEGDDAWSSLQRILKTLPLEDLTVDITQLPLERGAKLELFVDPELVELPFTDPEPFMNPELPRAAEAKEYRLLAELLITSEKEARIVNEVYSDWKNARNEPGVIYSRRDSPYFR
jgi:hypothetical protein